MKLNEILEIAREKLIVPNEIPLCYRIPYLLGYERCLEEICNIVKERQGGQYGN